MTKIWRPAVLPGLCTGPRSSDNQPCHHVCSVIGTQRIAELLKRSGSLKLRVLGDRLVALIGFLGEEIAHLTKETVPGSRWSSASSFFDTSVIPSPDTQSPQTPRRENEPFRSPHFTNPGFAFFSATESNRFFFGESAGFAMCGTIAHRISAARLALPDAVVAAQKSGRQPVGLCWKSGSERQPVGCCVEKRQRSGSRLGVVLEKWQRSGSGWALGRENGSAERAGWGLGRTAWRARGICTTSAARGRSRRARVGLSR